MKLWTWQADEINPTVGGIDPRCPGSYYRTNSNFLTLTFSMCERMSRKPGSP